MIFDTTFLIDVMDNDASAVAKLFDLVGKGEPQLITAPTIFELFSGLARSKKPQQERNKVIKILEGQLVVNFDNNSAEKAGEIDGNLINEGKSIGVIDSMIAGIALEKKDKLLTRNVKDFSRIKGLEVETY
ncbi:PIN domain-containing protein [archaeon]|nr:PIN domain-containing protein [archaeon]